MASKIEQTIQLHNGIQIPALGYRVDKDRKDKAYQDILNALEAGFRHFDLPADPETEKICARAFRDSGIQRYELFLTLKLSNDEHGYNRALRALDHSLKRLDTDYADLYLVNWPNPLRFRSQYETVSVETWRALEEMYKTGKAHAIGLANSQARHIEHILSHAEISPMVNQARIYPGFPFSENLNCADEHKIQTIGFLPPDHQKIMQSQELAIFAKKYKTSPRNICIRYMFEKGCIALCQEDPSESLAKAKDSFGFSISQEDMKYLDVMKNYGPEDIDPDTCDF